jgi:hypothetical protein
VLDLDDHDGAAAGILDAMPRSARDIHRSPRLETARLPLDDDAWRSLHDDPVLGAEAMRWRLIR